MIWIALSILCSTLIFISFRLFTRYGIDNLQAVVVNYIVAFTVGQASYGFSQNLKEIPDKPWFLSIVILGFVFISLFLLMAWVSQNLGVSAASVAVKMSVIIPVVFGILYFKEGLSWLKGIGIAMALLAVFLATYKPKKAKADKRLMIFPLIVFLGSGFLDTFLNYNEKKLIPSNEHALFASSIFGMAALLGLLLVLIRKFKNHQNFEFKSIVGGIALGIPNYGSIYFLLKALNNPALESSNLFAINNVGVVALSTFVGTIAFSEKLSVHNKLGLLLAIVSILLVFLTF